MLNDDDDPFQDDDGALELSSLISRALGDLAMISALYRSTLRVTPLFLFVLT